MIKEQEEDFNYRAFGRFLNKKKALQTYQFSGMTIETDEENPQFVAYIPEVTNGIITNAGFRIRLEDHAGADWMTAKRTAEKFAPNLIEEFLLSDQSDSSNTS